MDEKRDGDLDVERAAGSEKLVGNTLGDYEIRELIRPTRKSWVYCAHDPMFDRDVAVKVLKPGQGKEREKQFERERKRLGKIEKHSNIATPYSGGRQGDYYYFAMELVKGRDLQEMIDSGETFSLERILNIAYSVTDAVDHSHKCGVEHKDIKLKNIKETEEKKGISVLDYGSTLTRDKSSDDVVAVGSVIQILLKHREKPQKKIPKRLEDIVSRAETGGYESPGEFKKAIESYKRNLITRRRAIKIGAGSAVLAVVGGSLYGLYRNHRHKNSIEYIVRQIENTDAEDYERLDLLLVDFCIRVGYQKILPLYEDEEVAKRAANHETIQSYEGERIDLGGYFFATDSEGDWHFPDRIKSTSGRVVRIFRNLHNITGDVRFAELEEQAASHIKFNKERERGLEPIRCLHADRDILKAARYFYERGAYNPEIGFYDIGSAFYSRFGNQVAENERIISAHSLEMILPLILEASKRTTDPDLAAAYREHIIRHTDAIEKYLIRQDDTIRDLAKFNLETGEITEGNYWSHSPEASTSLYQAIAVDWFAIMFELTGNEEYQKTARKLIQPYILTLPSDYIPYFVIPRGTGIPKDMPRNTAAALRMGLALQNHPWLLPQQQRDSLFYGTLKSVIVNHADTNPNTDAIITSMCYNYRTKSYMNSCIVWGVDSFIEIVRGIKEKD